MDEEYEKVMEQLIMALDKHLNEGKGDIGIVQNYVLAIGELAKRGTDLGPAIPVLKKAISWHLCDHGCPVDAMIGELLTKYYKKNEDKDELSNLLKDPRSNVRFGVLWALRDMLGTKPKEAIPLFVKLLADDYDLIRLDTSTALKGFINQEKENAKLVLEEIGKSNIDKSLPEVKKIIEECENYVECRK